MYWNHPYVCVQSTNLKTDQQPLSTQGIIFLITLGLCLRSVCGCVVCMCVVYMCVVLRAVVGCISDQPAVRI